MSGFLWASGHLGWGIFALGIFTGLWLLLADWHWRVRRTRFASLLLATGFGWIIGAGVIVLIVYLVANGGSVPP
jgi:hypothetical protein